MRLPSSSINVQLYVSTMSWNAGWGGRSLGITGMELVTCRKSGQILSTGPGLYSRPIVNLMIWLPDLYALKKAPGWSQQLTEPVLTPSVRLFQGPPHMIVQIPKILSISPLKLCEDILESTIWQNLKKFLKFLLQLMFIRHRLGSKHFSIQVSVTPIPQYKWDLTQVTKHKIPLGASILVEGPRKWKKQDKHIVD